MITRFFAALFNFIGPLWAFQYAVAIRNAQLDQVEVQTGTSPLLRQYTGAEPATTATAASGTLVAEGSLPVDWMNAASAGTKTKLGAWTVTGLPAAGAGLNVGYFRIYDTAGTTCYVQGDVTVTGGGGNMTMNNINIANGQVETVNTFSITAGNA